MPAHTSVFVERVAHNAAMLHPHPQENAAAVCELLARQEWNVSMVGPEKPVRGGVLYFENAPIDDSILGALADDLNNEVDAGVAAYAYGLADSVDEAGDFVLVFRREGQAIPQVGNRVILTHTYLFDDAALTWLFGAPDDLFQACVALEQSGANVHILPVYSDLTRPEQGDARSIDAVHVRHLRPVGNSDEAGVFAREVVDVLTMAGFSGPILFTDHRQGADPDSSRLQAGY